MLKTDNRLCLISSDGRNWFSSFYGNRGDSPMSNRIRTYLPGKVDDRFGPFKQVKSLRSLARHLIGKNKQTPVIAKVMHVQELTGWKNKDFAPVVEMEFVAANVVPNKGGKRAESSKKQKT